MENKRELTAVDYQAKGGITLRYEEDLSLNEIARKMGRSIGTVKAHLFQLHHKLREMLLPYLWNDGFETWGSDKHL